VKPDWVRVQSAPLLLSSQCFDRSTLAENHPVVGFLVANGYVVPTVDHSQAMGIRIAEILPNTMKAFKTYSWLRTSANCRTSSNAVPLSKDGILANPLAPDASEFDGNSEHRTLGTGYSSTRVEACVVDWQYESTGFHGRNRRP